MKYENNLIFQNPYLNQLRTQKGAPTHLAWLRLKMRPDHPKSQEDKIDDGDANAGSDQKSKRRRIRNFKVKKSLAKKHKFLRRQIKIN